MRRNRIQVSSGTYCNAPAQLLRRMMSQMDFTAPFSDCCEACFFEMGVPWNGSFDRHEFGVRNNFVFQGRKFVRRHQPNLMLAENAGNHFG